VARLNPQSETILPKSANIAPQLPFSADDDLDADAFKAIHNLRGQLGIGPLIEQKW
jgi:hypothetical protein